MKLHPLLPLLLACFLAPQGKAAPTEEWAARPGAHPPPLSSYARWKNGPSQDGLDFPIGVWLQNPRNAARYKAAGINLYVALWRGPTASQLAELRVAGMKLVCEQNSAALENRDNPTIVGWMHGDEPDNAQSLGEGKGYGPPISPERIIEDYQRLQSADPTRPVMLNLGQGVAWDNYIGRGVRRNHPEDYAQYLKGCDIASFDIYPVVHDAPEVAGKLEFVARGVQRLVEWAGGDKIVWNCIECTHISNPTAKATPEQVRAEVWMALVHGSRGLIYFVHQFEPSFREAALLDDPPLLAAITRINRQIAVLAPVLNSATVTNGVKLAATLSPATHPDKTENSGSQTAPIAWMQKRLGNVVYLFCVNMQNTPAEASFTLESLPLTAAAEVLGEDRRLALKNGEFADQFKPYEVHLYSIRQP